MSESQQHADSVNIIKDYVYSDDYFTDFIRGLIPQKEVSVHGAPLIKNTSRADIEFSHYLDQIYIIGEAKTLSDSIEDNLVQLENYINYLNLKNNPWLIYAVPYIQIATTKNIIQVTLRKLDAERIQFRVLSNYF